MIYENKIDWNEPNKTVPLVSHLSKFRSVVLNFQIGVEGELEDIIKRKTEAIETKYIPFKRRVKLVRDLIGKTPDEEIWPIIKSLGKLRNEYSHGRFTEAPAGKKKIQHKTADILRRLKGIQPDLFCSSAPEPIDIITQAHFMVQRFFREINEGLDKRGLHITKW